MAFQLEREVGPARRAALQVLLHNARAGRNGLPRAAGWGYAEPYTRDLMIGALGVFASQNEELAGGLKNTLDTLAEHQSPRGLIPGIADEPGELGAGDTTPLFLIGLAAYRDMSRAPGYLDDAAQDALDWCEAEGARALTAQRPKSDWCDGMWRPGQGLYVNALVHGALVLFGRGAQAERLRGEMGLPVGTARTSKTACGGLRLPDLPYLALWSDKKDYSSRFDLLGNCLAILNGAVSQERAVATLLWVEETCETMRRNGELSLGEPNLMPFIQQGDADWRKRYGSENRPGEYHNGGIWPFVCGFHVAALVAVGQLDLAERKLIELTELCARKKDFRLDFGFNEWLRASDGRACGEDYQSWSASMYLYACGCVEAGRTPLFEAVHTQACAGVLGPPI